MKLISKERVGGRIHRKYDKPRTPYQRVMESKEVSQKTKEQLKQMYQSLNPAQLKRNIDFKLDLLYQAYQRKTNNISKVDLIKKTKKLKPTMVTFYTAQQDRFRLPN